MDPTDQVSLEEPPLLQRDKGPDARHHDPPRVVAHAHDHLELARRPRDGDALYARGAHAQQHVQVVGVDLADLLPARSINFRLSYRGPKRKLLVAVALQ